MTKAKHNSSKPPWLKVKWKTGKNYMELHHLMENENLHT
ncbi:MAG: lipoyl synthase, partial [Planctomycetota bacterium]